MEKGKPAEVALAGLAAGLFLALAVVMPTTVHQERRIGMSPDEAVERISTLPQMSALPLGEPRGWVRVNGGWTVMFQPEHGSWLTQAWVGDLGEVGEIRVIAASWLPGVRLSRAAAQAISGQEEIEYGVARDRLARRDWRIGERNLLGALPAGGSMPTNFGVNRSLWCEALIAGLLLAGAVARRLSPHLRSPRWPFAVAVTALVVFIASQSSILPERAFAVEVRPWVAQMAFDVLLLLLLGGISYAAYQFPSARGVSLGGFGVLAFVAGIFVGRFQPVSVFAELAGLPLALVLLPALAVLVGWLIGLAADGVRGLLPAHRFLQVGAGVSIAVTSWIWGGQWFGIFVVLACALIARRGGTTATGVIGVLGWIAASVGAFGEWPMAQAIWLVLLVAGSAWVLVVFCRNATIESSAAAGIIKRIMGKTSRWRIVAN